MVTFGQDFNHLETDGSPLYNSFTNAMKPSTFGHIVNYLNSSFPIRKYLPIHELQEAAFHREKARDFIRAHVSARLEALWKDEAANGNAPDALQYLVEHSDSGWGKNEIVEYVCSSHLEYYLLDSHINLLSTGAESDGPWYDTNLTPKTMIFEWLLIIFSIGNDTTACSMI